MANLAQITLVGAGPGDVGLMTLRGKQALENADVVLYDRLVGDGILALIPPQVTLVDVGKNAGDHPVPQEEIHALLVKYVSAGKRVVRLKGGDPYLFGRGAEEICALSSLGASFEVVPGITSAIAAPAYAGIPVTHRDCSSSLHIFTAHAKRGAQIKLPYEHMTKLGGTLVFLMGVGSLGELRDGLLGAGMAADTPAALVESATTPHQRSIVSTLTDIMDEAQRQSIQPPAVFIVGEVCRYAPELNWFERLPLTGITALVASPDSGQSRLAPLLREAGCDVVRFPCIATQPRPMPTQLGEKLHSYSWIVLTSASGVDAFFDGLRAIGKDMRCMSGAKFAVVGTATGEALSRRGIIADYCPEIFDAAHLAQGLLPLLHPNERVLLYRSAIGADILPDLLRQNAVEVDDIPAYDTAFPTQDAAAVRERLEQGAIDFVLFTSASTVRGFLHAMGDVDTTKISCICIGEQTLAQALAHGFRAVKSDEATLASMTEKLIEQTERRQSL